MYLSVQIYIYENTVLPNLSTLNLRQFTQKYLTIIYVYLFLFYFYKSMPLSNEFILNVCSAVATNIIM